ncbi:hypothetical protein BTA35_0212715 [Oceanospirillum linum]|uniref:Uncharacterized protein n=1 Tax=Oceanospirillum linum TaxID=966 RepID=A0A1T1HA36_OCELI|nr:hypothetical protein BTA35_0212715 [Oceanospirillum linum]
MRLCCLMRQRFSAARKKASKKTLAVLIPQRLRGVLRNPVTKISRLLCRNRGIARDPVMPKGLLSRMSFQSRLGQQKVMQKSCSLTLSLVREPSLMSASRSPLREMLCLNLRVLIPNHQISLLMPL